MINNSIMNYIHNIRIQESTDQNLGIKILRDNTTLYNGLLLNLPNKIKYNLKEKDSITIDYRGTTDPSENVSDGVTWYVKRTLGTKSATYELPYTITGVKKKLKLESLYKLFYYLNLKMSGTFEGDLVVKKGTSSSNLINVANNTPIYNKDYLWFKYIPPSSDEGKTAIITSLGGSTIEISKTEEDTYGEFTRFITDSNGDCGEFTVSEISGITGHLPDELLINQNNRLITGTSKLSTRVDTSYHINNKYYGLYMIDTITAATKSMLELGASGTCLQNVSYDTYIYGQYLDGDGMSFTSTSSLKDFENKTGHIYFNCYLLNSKWKAAAFEEYYSHGYPGDSKSRTVLSDTENPECTVLFYKDINPNQDAKFINYSPPEIINVTSFPTTKTIGNYTLTIDRDSSWSNGYELTVTLNKDVYNSGYKAMIGLNCGNSSEPLFISKTTWMSRP